MAEVVRIERRQVAKDGTHERECRPLHRAPLKSRERERRWHQILESASSLKLPGNRMYPPITRYEV